MTCQGLLYHDFGGQATAFVGGFQEINPLMALAQVKDGMVIQAVFIELAASDVVNLNIPLALADVHIKKYLWKGQDKF